MDSSSEQDHIAHLAALDRRTGGSWFVDQVERYAVFLVRRELVKFAGDRELAARSLGISRSMLYRILQRGDH